jgi:hypothetical protein
LKTKKKKEKNKEISLPVAKDMGKKEKKRNS